MAALAAAAIAALVAGGYVWGSTRGDSRQDEVAERGERVMPFDLEQTTHRFAKRADGGVQTVVADDSSDTEQVRLVREHLASEARAFRAGRFDDPMAIHGHEMPGLAELRSSAGRIEIEYDEVDAGGRITFRTDEPALVDALHAWFDAQLADHGEHAEEAP